MKVHTNHHKHFERKRTYSFSVGPMWSRFWDSFGAADDTDSQVSDPATASHSTSQAPSSRHLGASVISPDPGSSQLQSFPEITPNESASMVAHSQHSGSSNNKRREDNQSSLNDTDIQQHQQHHGTDGFAFKFTSASGKTHRFMSSRDNYSLLYQAIQEKAGKEYEGKLQVYYTDDDGDQVLINSDADVSGAVNLAERLGQNRVLLEVHSKDEPTPMQSQHVQRRGHQKGSVNAQDLLLPAAITFLGAVIVGVVVFSKASDRR